MENAWNLDRPARGRHVQGEFNLALLNSCLTCKIDLLNWSRQTRTTSNLARHVEHTLNDRHRTVSVAEGIPGHGRQICSWRSWLWNRLEPSLRESLRKARPLNKLICSYGCSWCCKIIKLLFWLRTYGWARQIYVAMIAKISATIMELFSERSGVLSGKKFDIKIVIDHQKLARCNRFLPGFSRFHHHLSISIFVTMWYTMIPHREQVLWQQICEIQDAQKYYPWTRIHTSRSSLQSQCSFAYLWCITWNY